MPETDPLTEDEILQQQLAHLDEEGDRVGDPLGGNVDKP